MSVLLQETDRLIQEDHGGAPGIEKIEKAIRAGKAEIFLYGERYRSRLLQESLNQSRSKRLDPYAEVNA